MSLSNSQEDYLTTIHDIIKEKGYARTVDIAVKLGVSSPSVNSMLKKLALESVVKYDRNSPVVLTEKGKELAESVKKKHEIFAKFFELILVPEHIAKKDALKIEHNLSPITIKQIKLFIDYHSEDLCHCDFHKKFNEFCMKK